MQASSPIVKHLVLVGGGHSHLAVLRRFAMKPLPGLALTLITRDVDTPYSGSMPAYLSGLYDKAAMHIDLRPLAQCAGARLIQHEVTSIDLDSRRIDLPHRPPLEFDLLSLNIGSRPDATRIPGSHEFAIGIKPIDQFLRHWESMRKSALARLQNPGETYSLTIVGGGPASVELGLASQYRLHQDLGLAIDAASGLRITIVSADPALLAGHNLRVQRFVSKELQRRGIEFRLHSKVREVSQNTVILENGNYIFADDIVFATGASLPNWPAAMGLKLSEDGFIEVNNHLQSSSHEFVFVAGDAATIKGEPRPKSGVYAVRQGKILAHNLARFATGGHLRKYHPQKQALALMSMGNERAIASRGRLFMQGRLPWLLKHRIDSAFVNKYSQVPDMESALNIAPGLVDSEEEQRLRQHAMRCAGCGAKVAGDVLDEVLQLLPEQDQVAAGVIHQGIEDASRIKLADQRSLLQSVDYLKTFVHDPWLFARIATNHCLSDLYAMGVMPHSALAIVGLPQANRKYSRAQLLELMLGCQTTLAENDCILLGGHSAETSELHLGLCVNGFAGEDSLLTKHGMQPGERLILTRALGTGTLLAADMRGRASHSWMHNALQQMLGSNRQAAEIFVAQGASSCTDITGFGLAGHLLEMLAAESVQVRLSLASIPRLDGATDCLRRGIVSSLHGDNRRAMDSMEIDSQVLDDAALELLFDPQTAGGLLASVAPERADQCLRQLQEAGYRHAAIIGEVLASHTAQPRIKIR